MTDLDPDASVDLPETTRRLAARLRSALAGGELARYRTVVMHDFSLDHLVHLDDFEQFAATARAVHARKGGLLPRSQQTIQQGGCAANTATTLARLGVQTAFITRTDELGAVLLDYYLGRAGVDLSGVKQDARLALMAALEIGADKINIMINDEDSFCPFGFDDLTLHDLEMIEAADLVGVFDWGLNLKGTDLAGRLFEHLRGNDRMTYLDTSDPAPRRAEIPELFERVLSHPALTQLNLNENELHQYAGAETSDESVEGLLAMARDLKGRVPASLNVHTTRFSMHVSGQAVAVVPTYRLAPLRTTGAGDSWNGGNILGLLLKLPPAERLMLANAVAGYYIVSPTCQRPALAQVIEFIDANACCFRRLSPGVEAKL